MGLNTLDDDTHAFRFGVQVGDLAGERVGSAVQYLHSVGVETAGCG